MRGQKEVGKHPARAISGGGGGCLEDAVEEGVNSRGEKNWCALALGLGRWAPPTSWEGPDLNLASADWGGACLGPLPLAGCLQASRLSLQLLGSFPGSRGHASRVGPTEPETGVAGSWCLSPPSPALGTGIPGRGRCPQRN